eukprot:9793958-Ditylum_brightwellii.AAC.1
MGGLNRRKVAINTINKHMGGVDVKFLEEFIGSSSREPPMFHIGFLQHLNYFVMIFFILTKGSMKIHPYAALYPQIKVVGYGLSATWHDVGADLEGRREELGFKIAVVQAIAGVAGICWHGLVRAVVVASGLVVFVSQHEVAEDTAVETKQLKLPPPVELVNFLSQLAELGKLFEDLRPGWLWETSVK